MDKNLDFCSCLSFEIPSTCIYCFHLLYLHASFEAFMAVMFQVVFWVVMPTTTLHTTWFHNPEDLNLVLYLQLSLKKMSGAHPKFGVIFILAS
jgi:hypothetical protein